MAIIQRKNPSGQLRYVVRLRDSVGKWFPTKTFDRKTDAERYERSLLMKRDRGGLTVSSERRQMTFGDYWQQWASECRGRVSDGWKMSQDTTARKYILPMLGHLKLLEIRSQEVSRLLASLQGEGLSAQSILHVYGMLHKAFEDAVEFYELMEGNPVKKRFRPRVHRVEREFLSPDDAWKLLEAARHHPVGPAIWVSTLAGLRPGEVQALRWSAIDFERGQILIRATFNKKMRVLQNHPKQKDWGRAPLPEPLRIFLEERRKGKKPEDFVCPNIKGGMLSYESLSLKVLPRLCKKARVKRVTPHELRHSCTELYVQAGASAEDLRRLLNHKSLSATVRYMHRTDERLQGIAAKISQPGVKPPEPSPTTVKPKLRLVGGSSA